MNFSFTSHVKISSVVTGLLLAQIQSTDIMLILPTAIAVKYVHISPDRCSPRVRSISFMKNHFKFTLVRCKLKSVVARITTHLKHALSRNKILLLQVENMC